MDKTPDPDPNEATEASEASAPDTFDYENIEVHPLAELTPGMDTATVWPLRASIQEVGLLHQLWIYEDMLLDGRGRKDICRALGIKLNATHFRTFTGTRDEALRFVVKLNLTTRKQITLTQRVVLASDLANLGHGGGLSARSKLQSLGLTPVSMDEAAELSMTTCWEGVLRTVEVAREVTGADPVHAAGYCVGGTILTALMAWLIRDGNGAAPPIGHFTLLTALADFAAPGDIEFFIDRDSLGFLEGLMDQSGYLDGAAMAWSFRMLRSNGLIWHYVVRSYLFGEDPPPFDVLYWNTDATRLPARMHATYLRECYVKNALIEPDALTLGGRGIDLRRIRQPLYMVGTEQDHIAPWKETFKLCGAVQGPIRYVLATSGHIMGIVSPPVDPPKRGYWVGDAEGHRDPKTWRAGIPKVLGSWWEDWAAWLAERCGPLSEPPPLGSARPALGDAPGTYVLEK